MTLDPDEDLTTVVLEHQLDAALINVGLVVGQGAMMERALEQAFCALVGSKYAAVVAAGQDVARLIDGCAALVKAHSELSGEHRHAVLDALIACRAANKRRSELVHSIHYPQPDLRPRGRHLRPRKCQCPLGAGPVCWQPRLLSVSQVRRRAPR